MRWHCENNNKLFACNKEVLKQTCISVRKGSIADKNAVNLSNIINNNNKNNKNNISRSKDV